MVGCPLSVDASKAVPNDVDDASYRRVSSRTTFKMVYSINLSSSGVGSTHRTRGVCACVYDDATLRC